MHRGILLAVALVTFQNAYSQTCPIAAPTPGRVIAFSLGSNDQNCAFCAAGEPITFYDSYTTYEPCDTIKFDFGDGASQVREAIAPPTTHTYTVGGTYRVTATIQNSLGSATSSATFVIGNGVF